MDSQGLDDWMEEGFLVCRGIRDPAWIWLTYHLSCTAFGSARDASQVAGVFVGAEQLQRCLTLTPWAKLETCHGPNVRTVGTKGQYTPTLRWKSEFGVF